MKWLGFEGLLPPPAPENSINHCIRTQSAFIYGLNYALKIHSQQGVPFFVLEDRQRHVQKAILALLAEPWESRPCSSAPVCPGTGGSMYRWAWCSYARARETLFILFPVLLSHTRKDISLFAQVQSCHLFTVSWGSERGGRGNQV